MKKIILNVENDFEEAQKIIDSGRVTEGYDIEAIYRDRVHSDLVGTYQIKIDREEDYRQFIRLLSNESIVFDFSVSFQEWKERRKETGEKLGKFLRKKGVSQFLLDFYSQQITEEETFYLTISDRVQHVAGMSYYSSMDWDSMSGSSCQDPRNEYSECKCLLSSLKDEKLFIIFLHKSLDDLCNLEKKMIARSVARLVHINGKQYMIATRLYGNSATKNHLYKAILHLNDIGVFHVDQMKGKEDCIRHIERQKDCTFLEEAYEEIHVYENVEDYVNVDCPLCGGSGNYRVYDSLDRPHDIYCPSCDGSGLIEIVAAAYVDEWIEVETEEEWLPYAEGYSHYGDHIYITLSPSILGIEKED